MAAAATAVSVFVAPAVAAADVSSVNGPRTAAGLPPVSEDGGLTALAQQQSAQMAASGSLFHSSNLAGEVNSVLPSYTGAAENVGQGPSVATITSLFMASPTHRSAILGNFNTAGVGVAVGGDGRIWMTQMFARTGGVAPNVMSSTAGPAARSARVRSAAARSGRRCSTRTLRVTRRVGGRRVTRLTRTQRCTKAKRRATKQRRSYRRRGSVRR